MSETPAAGPDGGRSRKPARRLLALARGLLLAGVAAAAALLAISWLRTELRGDGGDVVAGNPGPGWNVEPAGDGVALVRREASGAEAFRLVCLTSGELYAELPGLTRIGSEDRLTLGAGDQLAVLVVSMDGPAQGLRATGAREAGFLESLGRGAPLAVSYSARQLAPGAPPAELRAAFVAACR
ncbi:hypothetical protein [Phenylobacterium sp.]|uniref:hypothetical protein n=1 Tax=Phenylobacterium sp. TaxID=1871053 RepID=UPI002F9318F8